MHGHAQLRGKHAGGWPSLQALGAARFVERLQASLRARLENLVELDELAPARRRKVGGRSVTLREYVLDAGARDFLVLC